MSSTTNLRQHEDYETLWDIVYSFEEVMKYQDSALILLAIRPESELKYPKSTIKRALATLILIEDNIDVLLMLATAYLMLGDFYPDEDYNYFRSKLGKIGEFKPDDTENTERFIKEYEDDKVKKVIEQHQNLQASNIKELEFLFYLAKKGEVWEKYMRGIYVK